MSENHLLLDLYVDDNDENLPPNAEPREINPEDIEGLRPVLFALAALAFHLFLPGSFIFLDEEDNIVSALLYCEDSQRYMCVLHQTHGRCTHYRHYPVHEALQNG
ncbi:unnamed protein product [Caenorhabditis brenneri]